jgi:hypothetical protein
MHKRGHSGFRAVSTTTEIDTEWGESRVRPNLLDGLFQAYAGAASTGIGI